MKRCFYELLGVERTADEEAIKKAYRKLALKWHPDKARDLEGDAAKQRFQELQEAYETLSDKHERAWYDAHRAEILGGGAGHNEQPGVVNVWPFFSKTCYDENAPAGSAKSFYQVYGTLFESIHVEDIRWSDAQHLPERPAFGNADSPWPEVANFYRAWRNFFSVSSFGHEAKWKLSEAPNRDIRKLMEAENKKAQQTARKEYNETVKQLVEHVYRRDPRVVQHRVLEARLARDLLEEQERKKEQESEARRLERIRQQAEEEERREARRLEREALRAEGKHFEDSEDEKRVTSQRQKFVCVWCNKAFKSSNQYDTHLQSKKHLQVVKASERKQEKFKEELRGRQKAPVKATATPTSSVNSPRVPARTSKSISASDADSSDASAAESSEEAELSDASSSEESIDMTQFLRGGGGRRVPAAADVEPGATDLNELLDKKRKPIVETAKPKPAAARRRRAEAPAEDAAPSCGTEKCKKCGMTFPSRTKLMNHLREKGHAALKK